MGDIQMDVFRKALESSRTELTNGSRGRDALGIEASPDELDRIQEAGERENVLRSMERDSARLREVRDALRRIASDTFGICTGCEEPIVLKRLKAVPWAEMCVACQEDADRYVAESGRYGRADAMAA